MILAGEVVERTLTDKSGWSDERSYADDRKWIRFALRKGRVPKDKWPSLLKRIEGEIRRDLRDPEFRRKIERRASTYLHTVNKVLQRRTRKAA
jgi:hypothetical protein